MAAMGMIRHLRNYASAGLLSALVGLISFPILTRNLSVAEYGIVGLITSSLTLFIAVGKFGVQHSVIRFFSQIKNGNIDFTLSQMNNTVSMVFGGFACFTTMLWIICGLVVLPTFLQYENISSLFMLASGVVFIRLLGSGVMNFLRAQQRSGDVAVAQSLSRFLNMAFILSTMLVFTLNPWTVIGSLLAAELIGVGYAAYQYRHEFHFNANDVSGRLAKSLLFYGVPLMILESLSLVLRLSDRYLIESILGVDLLGQYSASYNFAGYIDIIILAAVIQAVHPAFMQMWETEGKVKTQGFLSNGIHLYLVVGIPFIVMFSITSPHLLSFLAGEKYSPGTVVIPYVAMSFLLEGATHFTAAGLYIFKNTKVLMTWSLVATVINLLLNVLLIPRFGIEGAAIVTVVSYLIFMIGVSNAAFKQISFAINYRSPILVLGASLVVYFVLHPINFGSDVLNFFIKGMLGTVALTTCLWFIDPVIKEWSTGTIQKFMGRGVKP